MAFPIGINQFCFPSHYDVREALEAAKRLGYGSFEVCMTAANATVGPAGGVTDALDISNYHNRLLNVASTSAQMMELKRMADDIGISITGVGGILSFSIYPLTAADPAVADKSMDAIRKMFDAARILGSDTVLVIPGLMTEEMDYAKTYALAQGRIAKLADEAPDLILAVENVWNHYLYSPLELNRFVDEMGRQNVGIYFDIANARRFGYPQQWIRAMGKRIQRIHVKDYRVSVDTINGFTNLLDGDVDYPQVLRALSDIGYNGELVIELIPPAKHQVELTLRHGRESMEALMQAAEEMKKRTEE